MKRFRIIDPVQGSHMQLGHHSAEKVRLDEYDGRKVRKEKEKEGDGDYQL